MNIIKIIKGTIVVIASIFLIAIVSDYLRDYYDDYMDELKGTESFQGTDVIVTIPEGASVTEIAKILKNKDLISFEKAFIDRLQESDYRGRLKSGTFTLNTGMSTLDMMAALSPTIEEKVAIDQLVVPEGFSIEQIALRCAKQGICTQDEFLAEVKSVTTSSFEYLSEVPAGANVEYKLQGFMFPATYDIFEDTTAKSLVQDMLNAFDAYYTEDMKARADELNLSTYEVITRASIVEREARVDAERATIAGVINNRLDIDMALQMCPTVLYPITDGLYNKDTVYYKDLEVDSPYNTYKYSGLPVGPIANPGLNCINAVLYPEEHNYLYYHVDNEEEGTHIFTETYEEHTNTQIIYPDDYNEEEQ